MIISLFMEEAPMCCRAMDLCPTAAAGAHGCQKAGNACDRQHEAQVEKHRRSGKLFAAVTGAGALTAAAPGTER
jgi:hypothetical protein